jgi:transglutaminase-like putative cysteine protease
MLRLVLLTIEHRNVYRYTQPVEWTIHTLMLRPIESHEVRIRSEALEIRPAHQLRWKRDAFDNSIALVEFTEKADELVIFSRYTVEQFNDNPFNFILEIYTNELPFAYLGEELPDLAPCLKPQYPQDKTSIQDWLRPFLDAQGRAKTLEFLIALNQSVPTSFSYRRRDEPGIQSPAETLRTQSGTCRDFAVLFMEAARHMGLASRYVSGYLCSTEDKQPEVATDSTHAWVEVYLPGGGWKGFDPTSGTLAGSLHVRVAVARDPAQATPILGNYLGDASVYQGMEVTVSARARQGTL